MLFCSAVLDEDVFFRPAGARAGSAARWEEEEEEEETEASGWFCLSVTLGREIKGVAVVLCQVEEEFRLVGALVDELDDGLFLRLYDR